MAPSGGTAVPDSCSLILPSNGAAYASTSYTFSSGTLTFVSYTSYWQTHLTDSVKLQCTFINGGVSSTVISNTLSLKSRTYLPTATNPITWYIEDSINSYTNFFMAPSGGSFVPNLCSLVYNSDGTAYTSTSYEFSSKTFYFASYAIYW